MDKILVVGFIVTLSLLISPLSRAELTRAEIIERLPEEVRPAITSVFEADAAPLESLPRKIGPFTVRILKANVGMPWSMKVAPNQQDLYYTDREAGKIFRLDLGTLDLETVVKISPVRFTWQAGLLGMDLDRNFSENRTLFVCYSIWKDTDKLEGPENRVSRIELLGGQKYKETVLLDHMAGSDAAHNGCQLLAGAQGKLFVTVGDTLHSELAQNMETLAGKVLRINLDGSIPGDNPWPGSPVWSLGHRNPLGLGINPATGSLWLTEHGTHMKDELNRIEKGGNYGWPLCLGVDACPGLSNHIPAQAEFDTGESVAISELTFYSGKKKQEWANDLFFVTLKTGRVYRVDLDGDKILKVEIIVNGEFGRLRDIVESPDGDFIISTEDYPPENAQQGESHIIQLSL